MDIVTLLSLFLTVIALALAGWQSLASFKQTKKLSSISDSLSTRYLGEFPEYLPQIANMLLRAKQDISIVCAISCHGVFTSPDGWLFIKQAIETALGINNKINVSCVFTDKHIIRSISKNQYQEAFSNWKNWCLNHDNMIKIQHFVNKFGSDQQIEKLSIEDFLDLIEKAATETSRTTYKGAKIIEVNFRPPLYMWIVDGKEAIISIPTTVPNYCAQAFYTTDARLLTALINMYNEYQRYINSD
jgi:hypothetical protein